MKIGFISLASLPLAFALVTGCDRQQPQDPPRTPPPATQTQPGQTVQQQQGQPQGQAAHQQGYAQQQGQPQQQGQTGQQRDERRDTTGMHRQGQPMDEQQRQAALRACEQLQGVERERCVQEVEDRDGTPPQDDRSR